jgi:hypothetical protein
MGKNKYEKPHSRLFTSQPKPGLYWSCGSDPLNRAGKAQTKPYGFKDRRFRAFEDKCTILGLNIDKRFAREWTLCTCKKPKCVGNGPA